MSLSPRSPVSLNQNNNSPVIPFPRVSEQLTAAFGIPLPLSLRPYGTQIEDLEINFNQPLRPQLETQLLACCTQDVRGENLDPDFFWRLGVSQRTLGLLSLVVLTEGDRLIFTPICPQASCQQVMEIAIAFDALRQLEQQSTQQDIATIDLEQHRFQVRRPTGQDQLQWLVQATQGQETDIPSMIETLLVNHEEETAPESLSLSLSSDLPQVIPALNQALDRLDPLVNFSLSVTCPHCGHPAEPEIDLGYWALIKLQRIQQQRIETVHRLAYHYHWSEQEILALPRWRCDRYLALIDREEAHR